MKNQKTLYLLVDTETTKHNGLVFDAAYRLLDKNMQLYAARSFLFKDVLAIEEPFFKEKIAEYWKLVEKGKIKPVSFKVFRRHFNALIKHYRGLGYRIILCAYNAEFDTRVLGETSKDKLNGAKFLDQKIEMFDLMHGWAAGCPVAFGEYSPFSPAGNIRTNAEIVYQYESGIHNFEERHVAFSDVIIEQFILERILRRKKKLHIVTNPKDFVSQPWRIVQERCRKPIEKRKAAQKSLPVIDKIADYTVSKNHKLKGGNPSEFNEEVITEG